MNGISASQLRVHYGDRLALDVPGLDFPTRGLVGLIGANGAGKTTLLRALAGLIPIQGTVELQGRNLNDLPATSRARNLAYLPQNAAAQWPLSVQQLVTLGRLPHRRGLGALNDADRQAVGWAMAAVDLEPLAHRAITALSGGERARGLLARSLAVRAPVLMVDEPTASLDPYHQLLIMEVLVNYGRNIGLVISVLHDLTLAARFCDRLVLVHGGAVAADGPPEQVLSDTELARCYHVQVVRSEHQGPIIVPIARVAVDEPGEPV
jgi:iron complex transport system ATP-binding protein